jgi:hypothetical protein
MYRAGEQGVGFNHRFTPWFYRRAQSQYSPWNTIDYIITFSNIIYIQYDGLYCDEA